MNRQSSKTSIETKYISHYDTLLPPINFELFDHTEGLPKGTIKSVVQTNDGYLWVSIENYGLVRYDGYHYRSFTPIQGDSSSLPSDIYKIVKSKRYGLWLASFDKGLIWFDLKTYKSNIIHNIPRDTTMNSFDWIEDRLGQVWVVGKGIFLYSPVNQSFEEISKYPAIHGMAGTPVDISKFSIGAAQLSLSGDGSFWIPANDKPGMLRITPKTKKITFYPWFDDLTLKILPDPDGRHIWFSDLDKYGRDRICRYNFQENRLLVITFKKRSNEEDEGRWVYKLSHIENDKLWMTNDKTIVVMNVRNFDTQLFKNQQMSGNLHILSGKDPYIKVVEGLNSVRWIYSDTKLLCNFPETNRFTYHKILPKDEKVCCYWKDEKNNIEWFGTSWPCAKLYKYDLSTHKLSSFAMPFPFHVIFSSFGLTKLNNNELLIPFRASFENASGIFVHATKLLVFNTSSFSFRTISKKISNHPTYTSDSIGYPDVCQDNQNNLWFSSNNGLFKYEINSDKFYDANIINPLIGKIDKYFVIISRDKRFIWAGGEDGTLKKIDLESLQCEKFRIAEDSSFCRPLCEDLYGNVYLTIFDSEGDRNFVFNSVSKNFFQVEGLPKHTFQAIVDSNNNVIAVDEENFDLWFYNHGLKFVRRFDAKDGLRQQYSWPILNQSGKNEILIDDCYRVHISFLYPKKEVPALHFASIKIFGNELTSTNNQDTLDTLILTHKENQLSFEFVALSFLPNNYNTYSCMLTGADTSWQQLGSANSITYSNLAPGEYTFKVKTANQDGVWGKERILHIVIIPAFWQTTWFKILAILIGILIVAGISYWLYRNRLYQLNLKNQLEKEKLEQQKKEAEFQKRLGDLTLSALRSQINPHFIFNCLNSIKLYATQNDVNAASEYLTKFAKLIRQVLDNCRNELITLAAELEVLRLYIEMEAMRFKEKLKSNISIENDIDPEYIEIPPLLLQPYVENAIWHGLMNKEEGGRIDIAVAMKNDSALMITIKDDGVGRAKAAELKSKTAIQHKSFGMKITSERLALINQIYKKVTSVTIDDLIDEKGTPAGTQVNVLIEI